jgi:serine/threonine-protein kinase RsbW
MVDMPEADDHVLLDLPASFVHVRLARLVASGIGSSAGFDVEEIEDLRIAVDEACGILIEAGATGRLAVRFDLLARAVHVDVSATKTGGACGAAPHGLAAEILGAVTDAWEQIDGGDVCCVRLHKRARASHGEGPVPPEGG